MTQDHAAPGNTLVGELQAQLAQLVAGFDARPAMRAMLDGTADQQLYVSFLVQSRHYVALTEPCLRAAGKRLRELDRHGELAELYFQKAEEEAGHDILIDEDLTALGLDPEKALADEPPGGWVNAYNTWITAATKGDHPLAFMGSAYVLEGLATLRAGVVAEALKRAGRIERIAGAVKFLELHAVADIGHVDDMDRVLDRLEDAAEKDAIIMTAAATRGAYLGMLDDVSDNVGGRWRQAA